MKHLEEFFLWSHNSTERILGDSTYKWKHYKSPPNLLCEMKLLSLRYGEGKSFLSNKQSGLCLTVDPLFLNKKLKTNFGISSDTVLLAMIPACMLL